VARLHWLTAPGTPNWLSVREVSALIEWKGGEKDHEFRGGNLSISSIPVYSVQQLWHFALPDGIREGWRVVSPPGNVREDLDVDPYAFCDGYVMGKLPFVTAM
jgi:hypothetical protein